MDKEFTDESIYDRLLSDKLSTNLGYIYENIVAQMLKASGKELYYHTIKKDDGKSYYEIDFVITRNNKLVPLEIKSSGYKTHKSLDEFFTKYPSRIYRRYLVYTKDYAKDADVICLPVYMTPFL